MNKISSIALRVLWVVIAIAAGWLFYLVSINLMIYFGLFSAESIEQGAGYALVEKVVFVWIAASVLSLGSIFTQAKIRLLFLSLPLILPTLFSLLYILSA